MSGRASASRRADARSHFAAKSGDVLTVSTPEAWRLRQTLRAHCNAIQRIADHGKIFATRLGHRQALVLANEEALMPSVVSNALICWLTAPW